MPVRGVLLILSVSACIVVLLVPVDVLLAAPESVREITLNARQFAFDPAIIRVNRGDRVILTVQAADVVHGLYVDGYGVNLRVAPGTSQRVEFVADRAGTFRYRCAVTCGSMHPFMIGELIVTPNDLYWRAVALAMISTAVTLIWLRLGPSSDRRNA
jgi:cytochrome c oxidase subunit II